MSHSFDMNKNPPPALQIPALASSVSIIILLTILTRPFGILREILTATYFGTQRELDTFLLAASIPIFICSIVGGGLVKAVVPGLSQAAADQERRGWQMLSRLSVLTILFAIPLVAMNLFLAPYIIKLLFPSQTTQTMRQLGVNVYRLLSPAILGGMLSGLFVGAANTFHFYRHTTLRSVAYNGMILGSLLLLHKKLGIYSLGVGLLLAEYSQLLVVLPPLWKRGFRLQKMTSQAGKTVSTVLAALFPAVFLTGMGHVNYLVDRTLAMPLGEGCLSSLHYAWKLILLPASLLSVAFATPLLTFLSHHEARKERRQTGRLFEQTSATLLFLAIPVTFLLLLTGRQIVALFYAWGRFGDVGISLTSSSLFFYSPGLPFQLLLPLLVAGFLAIKKPWIPVLVSLPLVPLNWLLDRYLMTHFSHAGIALSTSGIFFLNVSILYVLLIRYLGSPNRIKLWGRHGGFAVSTLVLFFIIWWFYSLAGGDPVSGRLNIIIKLFIVGVVTLGAYLILAHGFRIQVMKRLRHFLKRPGT